jgi:hypothetical protein
MLYFIKECPDDTIVLMTECGHIVSIHDRIEDAILACDDEYAVAPAPRPKPVSVERRRVLAAVN